MAGSMLQGVLFPACLRGTSESTRAAWSRIIDNVSTLEQWDDCLKELELATAESQTGYIILLDPDGRSVPLQSKWRLSWVPRLFVPDEPTPAFPPETIAAQRAIILRGMKECWFAIAMLQSDNRAPAFDFDVDDSFLSSFALPMLRFYVHWLPEILSLADRFAYGVGSRLVPFHDSLNPDNWWYLWAPFIGLAHQCGYISDVPRFLNIVTDHDGSMLAALVAERVIVKAGQRHCLRE